MTKEMSGYETEIRSKGELIFKKMENAGSSIFNKDWWYGRLMEWSMKNEHFKVQMFRFVDVLPYLNSSQEVARHLKEYFSDGGQDIPSIFNVGFGVGALAPGLMAAAVRKNVTQMAKMFIAGESVEEAQSVLRKSRKNKLTFTVDLLGEAALSEKEAFEYQRKYLELIEELVKESKNWDPIELLDRDDRGAIPQVNVSIKLSSLFSQINIKAFNESREILKERLRPLFRVAQANHVFINLDMEQYSIKDLTLSVFKDLIFEPEFKAYPFWGIVIQAYLKDSLSDVNQLIELARRREVPFTVRLVKGAYWDYETVLAAQRGWPVPVYTQKPESDANYEECAEALLKNYKIVRTALGSHNVRSLSTALVTAEKLGIPKEAFEIQMLYGMADPIKRTLADMGYRLREYTPIGELIPGMAYLVRRLLENTSNESFLKSKFADNVSTGELLKNPRDAVHEPKPKQRAAPKFENEPLLDFGFEINRTQVTNALASFRARATKDYPLVIDGKKISTTQTLTSLNPSKPSEIIGRVASAEVAHSEQAVSSATKTFEAWKYTPVETRAAILEKAAQIMIERRFELIAAEVLEAGKTWTEADGDITEAIDFCRYYAVQARRLFTNHKMGHIPGEVNLYSYHPRGVVAVIAPWNFPLAILCGMVAGAMVSGNTVVMKPAEQTPVIGALLMEILEQAGTPPGVVQFLPGLGEVVGKHLVDHPHVDMIAFTGSRAVGLQILEQTAKLRPKQRNIKKAIIEMGGKNAIIIDSDADLDEAVSGVVYSAFGFSGQKCSACSRVVVLNEIYDRFVERLTEAVKSLTVGPAEHPQSYLGPVIDEEAYLRIQRTIEGAKASSKLLYQADVSKDGYFVGPTVFGDVAADSTLAQEEIFGPVLAILRAETIEDALRIANGTAYALTGGVYSRSPANIEKVKSEFEVGNLYVNRQITGAMVERHPFGGFRMSGAGSKTGGPDYLLSFVEPRSLSENTLRRGFAPSDDEEPK